jgi:hypothetical protein
MCFGRRPSDGVLLPVGDWSAFVSRPKRNPVERRLNERLTATAASAAATVAVSALALDSWTYRANRRRYTAVYGMTAHFLVGRTMATNERPHGTPTLTCSHVEKVIKQISRTAELIHEIHLAVWKQERVNAGFIIQVNGLLVGFWAEN